MNQTFLGLKNFCEKRFQFFELLNLKKLSVYLVSVAPYTLVKNIRLGVKSGEKNYFYLKAPAFSAFNAVNSADSGGKHFSPHSAGSGDFFHRILLVAVKFFSSHSASSAEKNFHRILLVTVKNFLLLRLLGFCCSLSCFI